MVLLFWAPSASCGVVGAPNKQFIALDRTKARVGEKVRTEFEEGVCRDSRSGSTYGKRKEVLGQLCEDAVDIISCVKECAVKGLFET